MTFNCCRWRLVKIECISCYCCLVFKSSFGTESFLFCLAVSASLFVHSNSNFEIKIKVNFNLSKRRKSICPGKSGGFSITHREGEVIVHSLTQSFRPPVCESLRRLHLRPSHFSACYFFYGHNARSVRSICSSTEFNLIFIPLYCSSISFLVPFICATWVLRLSAAMKLSGPSVSTVLNSKFGLD